MVGEATGLATAADSHDAAEEQPASDADENEDDEDDEAILAAQQWRDALATQAHNQYVQYRTDGKDEGGG